MAKDGFIKDSDALYLNTDIYDQHLAEMERAVSNLPGLPSYIYDDNYMAGICGTLALHLFTKRWQGVGRNQEDYNKFYLNSLLPSLRTVKTSIVEEDENLSKNLACNVAPSTDKDSTPSGNLTFQPIVNDLNLKCIKEYEDDLANGRTPSDENQAVIDNILNCCFEIRDVDKTRCLVYDTSYIDYVLSELEKNDDKGILYGIMTNIRENVPDDKVATTLKGFADPKYSITIEKISGGYQASLDADSKLIGEELKNHRIALYNIGGEPSLDLPNENPFAAGTTMEELTTEEVQILIDKIHKEREDNTKEAAHKITMFGIKLGETIRNYLDSQDELIPHEGKYRYYRPDIEDLSEEELRKLKNNYIRRSECRHALVDGLTDLFALPELVVNITFGVGHSIEDLADYIVDHPDPADWPDDIYNWGRDKKIQLEQLKVAIKNSISEEIEKIKTDEEERNRVIGYGTGVLLLAIVGLAIDKAAKAGKAGKAAQAGEELLEDAKKADNVLDTIDDATDVANATKKVVKEGADVADEVVDEVVDGTKKAVKDNADDVVEDVEKSAKKELKTADDVTENTKKTGIGGEGESFKFSDMSEKEISEIVEKYRKKAPIEIPDNANYKAKSMADGYEQISFKWNDGTYKYEARWHTRTSGAPEGQGNTWVIQRTVPGNGATKPSTQFMIGDDEWVEGWKWYDAIKARKDGTATLEQIEILDKGHWKE